MASMAGDAERGLRAYLNEVAAGTPAPGGGSVAAVVGALAAALGEMVANLTLGRDKYASAEALLRPARERLSVLRIALLEATVADEAAYQAYRRASSLPRGSDADKSARADAMQRTLLEATNVPLGVARVAGEVAEILEIVAREGNPHVRSDAALGAILAEAALRGALLNVRGNAALLEDRELASAARAEADVIEASGRQAAIRAYATATGSSAAGGFR
jgi:formiminotetrahydrofolate cyclodeaminase